VEKEETDEGRMGGREDAHPQFLRRIAAPLRQSVCVYVDSVTETELKISLSTASLKISQLPKTF